MTRKRIFVDGIESINITEGMVRLELFNYIPDKNHKQGEPLELEITNELIMSPQNFLRAFTAMQNLVGKLEKAGIVRKNETPENPPENPPSRGISPNFTA